MSRRGHRIVPWSARFCAVALAASAAGLVSPADAVSMSAKPSKPIVTVISAIRRAGSLNVTVIFERALTNVGSPILSTQVKVGTKTCIAAGRATRCTVKGLSYGNSYRVTARARNRNGLGRWSAPVSFRATHGFTWRRDSTVPGSSPTTIAGEISATVPSTTTTLQGVGTVLPAAIQFDLKGAIGLALRSGVSSAGVRKVATGSNLQKLDESGSVKDALKSGSATVSRFLIAPNDKLYVVFSSKPVIAGSPCMLAEIDRDTGDPTCVETDTDFQFVSPGQSKSKFTSGNAGFRNLINDFQFDNQGAIYYLGTPGTKTQFPSLRCCSTYFGDTPSLGSVVRKYLNGKKTEFGVSSFESGKSKEPGFTDPMDRQLMLRRGIFNFLVTPDGSVVIDQDLALSGEGTSGVCMFARLDIWRPDGSRTSVKGLPRNDKGFDLSPGSQAQRCNAALTASEIEKDGNERIGEALSFVRSFGTSDVIVGELGRIFRINTLDGTAEELPFPRSQWCAGDRPDYLFDFGHYFCQDGTMWRGTWKSPSGAFFAVVGQDPGWESLFNRPEYERVGVRYGSGILAKVWPSLGVTPLGFDLPSAVLTRVESFLPIGDSVVATGTTADGGVQTVLFNTKDGTSQVLIPASDGLRPLKFSFNTRANKLLFTSAGRIGVIDFSNFQLKTSVVTTAIDDLQAFSS